MRVPEPDDLLWELPRAEEQDDRPAPVDAELRAYRAGALPSGEVTRLEWELSGSRAGRVRLAELAGITLARTERRRSLLERWAPAGLALAALLAVALLLVLNRRDPALPAFQVQVEGLAGERGGAGMARALPESAVRVRVEPKGEGRAGVRFTAYRLEEDALIRLEEPGEVTTEAGRGSAVLTARAERLVGSVPGTRPFFVVVNEKSHEPAPRVGVAGEGPEQSLRRAGAGQVHRVWLTILDARGDVR